MGDAEERSVAAQNDDEIGFERNAFAREAVRPADFFGGRLFQDRPDSLGRQKYSSSSAMISATPGAWGLMTIPARLMGFIRRQPPPVSVKSPRLDGGGYPF